MKIQQQLKPALISYWMLKAFKAFYPHITVAPCKDAPNSWKELQVFKGRKVLPVFNGNCENTIYQKPSDNIMFRAWHDSIHLEHNLSFNPVDEKKVGLIHCQQLRLIGAPTHVINAIYFDVVGQVEFYSHMGEFITNQFDFVQDCMVKGLPATIDQYCNPVSLDC